MLRCCLCAVEGPKENLAVITSTPGWQERLLELLLDGSPCLTTLPSTPTQVQNRPASAEGIPSSESIAHSPWEWAGPECQLIRALLRALHGHCVQHIPHGWTALEQTACHLRYCRANTFVTNYLHVSLAANRAHKLAFSCQ